MANKRERKAYFDKYNSARKEKLSAYMRKRRVSRTPEEKKRNNDYLREYNTGWSPEEYQAAFEAQGGRCAICGTHQSETGLALHADHRHTTGQKRGLLCNRCNPALGAFSESIEVLERAIVYLKIWEEK